MTAHRAPGIYVVKDDDWDRNAWTGTPNPLIRDRTIPWECKGAYTWLASHSKEFTLRADDLADAGPKGRNHAREMLRTLEQHGWLSREKVRNPETGRYDVHIYKLHASPLPVPKRTWTPSTAQKRTGAFTPAPARAGAGIEQEEQISAIQPNASDPARQTRRLSPGTERAGAGVPGAGEPGAGRSGTYKKNTKEDPPQPPAERGEPTLPLDGELPAIRRPCEHGLTRCRECGTSKRDQERVARAAVDEQQRRNHERIRDCGMCGSTGLRRDDGTECDHETPPDQYRAERDARIQALRVAAEVEAARNHEANRALRESRAPARAKAAFRADQQRKRTQQAPTVGSAAPSRAPHDLRLGA